MDQVVQDDAKDNSPEQGHVRGLIQKLLDRINQFGVKDNGVECLGQRCVLDEREGELAHTRVGLEAEPVESKWSQVDGLV